MPSQAHVMVHGDSAYHSVATPSWLDETVPRTRPLNPTAHPFYPSLNPELHSQEFRQNSSGDSFLNQVHYISNSFSPQLSPPPPLNNPSFAETSFIASDRIIAENPFRSDQKEQIIRRIEQLQDSLRDSRDELMGARFRLRTKRKANAALRRDTISKIGAAFDQVQRFVLAERLELPGHIWTAFQEANTLRDELGIREVDYEDADYKYDQQEWKYTEKENEFLDDLSREILPIPVDPFQPGQSRSVPSSPATPTEGLEQIRQKRRSDTEFSVDDARLNWINTRKRIETWLRDTVEASSLQMLRLESLQPQASRDYTVWWQLVKSAWSSSESDQGRFHTGATTVSKSTATHPYSRPIERASTEVSSVGTAHKNQESYLAASSLHQVLQSSNAVRHAPAFQFDDADDCCIVSCSNEAESISLGHTSSLDHDLPSLSVQPKAYDDSLAYIGRGITSNDARNAIMRKKSVKHDFLKTERTQESDLDEILSIFGRGAEQPWIVIAKQSQARRRSQDKVSTDGESNYVGNSQIGPPPPAKIGTIEHSDDPAFKEHDINLVGIDSTIVKARSGPSQQEFVSPSIHHATGLVDAPSVSQNSTPTIAEPLKIDQHVARSATTSESPRIRDHDNICRQSPTYQTQSTCQRLSPDDPQAETTQPFCHSPHLSSDIRRYDLPMKDISSDVTKTSVSGFWNYDLCPAFFRVRSPKPWLFPLLKLTPAHDTLTPQDAFKGHIEDLPFVFSQYPYRLPGPAEPEIYTEKDRAQNY